MGSVRGLSGWTYTESPSEPRAERRRSFPTHTSGRVSRSPPSGTSSCAATEVGGDAVVVGPGVEGDLVEVGEVDAREGVAADALSGLAEQGGKQGGRMLGSQVGVKSAASNWSRSPA